MFHKIMISAIAVSAISGSVYATTFDDIVGAISLPSNATNTVQNWSTLDAMQAVKWKPKSAQRGTTAGETIPNSFERFGTVTLTTTIKKRPQIKFRIYATGDKSNITSFEIDTKGLLGGANVNFGESQVNLQTMKSFFNKPVEVRVSKPSCSSAMDSTTWDLYSIVLPNRKPLFIKITSFMGAPSELPNTTFSFQNTAFSEDGMDCPPA